MSLDISPAAIFYISSGSGSYDNSTQGRILVKKLIQYYQDLKLRKIFLEKILRQSKKKFYFPTFFEIQL